MALCLYVCICSHLQCGCARIKIVEVWMDELWFVFTCVDESVCGVFFNDDYCLAGISVNTRIHK